MDRNAAPPPRDPAHADAPAPRDAASRDSASQDPASRDAASTAAARQAAAADAPQDVAPDAAQERALDFLHASALQHVVMADRKAGILFTLLSAALLFLFTRAPDALWPLGWAAGLWAVVVALLVAASALAFLVVLPRVSRGGAAELLFWGSVARHTKPEDYLAAVCRTDARQLARDKVVHCHQLSQICARKFRLLRVALLCAAVGLVLFLAALALDVPARGAGLPV